MNALLAIDVDVWKTGGLREQTRREHLLELEEVFGFEPFTGGHYRSIRWLTC
jgi:hypothetical protein